MSVSRDTVTLISYEPDETRECYYRVKLEIQPGNCTQCISIPVKNIHVYKTICCYVAREYPSHEIFVNRISCRSPHINTQYKGNENYVVMKFIYTNAVDNFQVKYPLAGIDDPYTLVKFYASLPTTEYIERYKYFTLRKSRHIYRIDRNRL